MIPVLEPFKDALVAEVALFNTVKLPKMTRMLERQLEENGGKFLVGDKVRQIERFKSKNYLCKITRVRSVKWAKEKRAKKICVDF